MFYQNLLLSCWSCISGHRTRACNHASRPLWLLKHKGRPLTKTTERSKDFPFVNGLQDPFFASRRATIINDRILCKEYFHLQKPEEPKTAAKSRTPKKSKRKAKVADAETACGSSLTTEQDTSYWKEFCGIPNVYLTPPKSNTPIHTLSNFGIMVSADFEESTEIPRSCVLQTGHREVQPYLAHPEPFRGYSHSAGLVYPSPTFAREAPAHSLSTEIDAYPMSSIAHPVGYPAANQLYKILEHQVYAHPYASQNLGVIATHYADGNEIIRCSCIKEPISPPFPYESTLGNFMPAPLLTLETRSTPRTASSSPMVICDHDHKVDINGFDLPIADNQIILDSSSLRPIFLSEGLNSVEPENFFSDFASQPSILDSLYSTSVSTDPNPPAYINPSILKINRRSNSVSPCSTISTSSTVPENFSADPANFSSFSASA
jgi:Copper fist DNA binding domain